MDWLVLLLKVSAALIGTGTLFVAIVSVQRQIVMLQLEVQRLKTDLQREKIDHEATRIDLRGETQCRIAWQREAAINVSQLRAEWIERAKQRDETHYTKRGDCIICLCTTSSLYAAVPCGHTSLCHDCADAIQPNKNVAVNCPTCRARVSQYIRIYETKEEDRDNDDEKEGEEAKEEEKEKRLSLRQRFIRKLQNL